MVEPKKALTTGQDPLPSNTIHFSVQLTVNSSRHIRTDELLRTRRRHHHRDGQRNANQCNSKNVHEGVCL